MRHTLISVCLSAAAFSNGCGLAPTDGVGEDGADPGEENEETTPDDDPQDLLAYTTYFGVTDEAARTVLALTDEAARVQNHLAKLYPDAFAGLWIEHEPTFQVVVAVKGQPPVDLRGMAGPALAPVIVTRSAAFSEQELERAVATLPMPTVPHSTSIDVRNNVVKVSVLAESRGIATEALARSPYAHMVIVEEVTALPEPVADIYGGLNLNGASLCTSGFSVKNASGTTGVLTAGHCPNTLSYAGVGLNYKAGSTAGNADAQWHTSGFVERAKIKIGAGVTRAITATRSYNNIVNGQFVCKYGRTTGRVCGTVEAKGVDPDGIFNPLNGVFVRVQNCPGPSIAEGGDSGGPVYNSNTAIGIVTHKDRGDIFCSYKMLFNSVTHTNAVLGLSIMVQ